MRRLEGKVIIVAGGGGIGGGLARRFASEGAQVVLGDVALAGAEAEVEAIRLAGGSSIAAHLDGADEASIAECVALTKRTYGGIDGIHCNFASFVDGGGDIGVVELPLAAFDETMHVNLRGYVLCTRAVVPEVLKRGGGAIIYTSSPAASKGMPNQVAYAIAKAGVQALMRHVASRYGAAGIRANCISPGSTMHERLEAELDESMKQWCLDLAIIKSRLGRPEDIAAMAALLMSDEGAYITGQTISVDGGVTMRM